MSVSNENIALARRLVDAIDNGNIAAAYELFSSDLKHYFPFAPQGLNRDEWKSMFEGHRKAFPNFRHEIQNVFSYENKVAIRAIVRGTHLGTSQLGTMPALAATGREVEVPCHITLTCTKGKVSEARVWFDGTVMMNQLQPNLDETKINVTNARRFFESFSDSTGRVFDEVTHPEFRHADAGLPTPVLNSRASFWTLVNEFRGAYPDFNIRVEEIFGEGRNVFCRWTFEGTQLGKLMGQIPPTGKKVKCEGCSTLSLAGGRVVEGTTTFDFPAMLAQLGVLPQQK